MIDINEAKKIFNEFVKKYDTNNEMIDTKYNHTFRVCENSLNICKSMNLNEEDTKLLILIGYLHDIGRFLQRKRYHSYIDSKTVEHADLGVNILFKDNLIRNFIDDNRYDNIIYKAVKYHNKLDLNYDLTSKEKLFCKAIRDADKLDIFHIATYDDNIKDFYALPYIDGEKLNNKVKEDFDNHRLVDIRNRKTAIDKLANILAFIYDLNLEESKKIITKDTIDNVINTFIKTFNVKDTSECLYLKDNILEYLNNT